MSPSLIFSPWESDPGFLAILEKIRGRTLVDPVRCWMLWQFAHALANTNARYAEVGVYKGGTAYLLAMALGGSPGSRLDLFDTFWGMPPCDPTKDLHKEGNFKDVTLPEVQAFLKFDNVALHQGLFPDTAHESILEGTRFRFVHVDCDIYRSVLHSCGYFFPRMESGGVIVFDDYGFPSCPGAKEAVDQFVLMTERHRIYLPTGQCFVQF